MEKRTDSANIWKIIAIAALCLLWLLIGVIQDELGRRKTK